jgi:hypothetical protein
MKYIDNFTISSDNTYNQEWEDPKLSSSLVVPPLLRSQFFLPGEKPRGRTEPPPNGSEPVMRGRVENPYAVAWIRTLEKAC